MSTTVMAACWPLQMPYAAKSVLVSLADNANDHGECWPSIDTISKRTCLHRASVIRAIATLEKMGHLSADRTNGRHTKYVVTPKLDLFETSRTEQPVAESNRSQKVTNRSHKATAPVAQSDTNRKEPSRTVIKKDIRADFDFTSWPEPPSEQVLADWLALRKRKRADVSATVIREMGKQLHLAQAKGYAVDDALGQCVMRGWQGLKADWLDDNRGSHETATRIGNRKLSAVERVEAAVAERRREREQREPIQGQVI